MKELFAPDGVTEIRGQLDIVTGVALLHGVDLDDDGKIKEFYWEGSTDMNWDGQRAFECEGQLQFVDENEDIWLFEDLVAKDAREHRDVVEEYQIVIQEVTEGEPQRPRVFNDRHDAYIYASNLIAEHGFPLIEYEDPTEHWEEYARCMHLGEFDTSTRKHTLDMKCVVFFWPSTTN